MTQNYNGNETTPVSNDGLQVIVGRLIGLRDNHRFSESVVTLQFSEQKYSKHDMLSGNVSSDNTAITTIHVPYGTTGLDEMWLDQYDGCLVGVRGTAKRTSNGRYWMDPKFICVPDSDDEELNHIIAPEMPAGGAKRSMPAKFFAYQHEK